MSASSQGIDPIHQFEVHPLFSDKMGIASFTNASLFMVIVVGVICLLMIGGTSARSVVPGRIQSMAEMAYEFVASTSVSYTHLDVYKRQVLMRSLVEPYLQTGELVEALPGWQIEGDIEVFLIFRKHVWIDPKVRAFVDFAMSHIPARVPRASKSG